MSITTLMMLCMDFKIECAVRRNDLFNPVMFEYSAVQDTAIGIVTILLL